MKKVLVLPLALLYLAISSGMVVNIHYCMGELASIGAGHNEGSSCAGCGMEEKKGCCDTEHKFLKADNDHLKAGQAEYSDPAPASVSKITQQTSSFHQNTVHRDLSYHSPPDQRSNLISLYVCVFKV